MRKYLTAAILGLLTATSGLAQTNWPERPIKQSPPDGYTILVGANATISINPALDPR